MITLKNKPLILLGVLLGMIALLLITCKDETPSEPQKVYTAYGEDSSAEITQPLSNTFTQPESFYIGVENFGLTTEDLRLVEYSYSIFDEDLAKLPWTDFIRYDGEHAPEIPFTVADIVKAASAMTDFKKKITTLVLGQAIFNNREFFTGTQYTAAIEILANGNPLLDALQTYIETDPIPTNPAKPEETWETIKQEVNPFVEAIPEDIQLALAKTIKYLLKAAELRDAAFEKLLLSDLTGVADTYRANLGYNYDFAATKLLVYTDFDILSQAAQVTVAAMEELHTALLDKEPVDVDDLIVNGPFGKIVISLSNTDSTWTESDIDTFLHVDLAGNDLYKGRIAGNSQYYYPISTALDVSGNDEYTLKEDWSIDEGYITTLSGCSQGTGAFGIAALIDGSGDDTYVASSNAQGRGVFGAGILVDHAGIDNYTGYHKCQGSAEFGYGLLLDCGSTNDTYTNLSNGQGFGGARGIGWLVDEGGDDVYLSIHEPLIEGFTSAQSSNHHFSGSQGMGFGLRGSGSTSVYLSGGMGALLDLGGNDSYACDVMCQGMGYYFGTGILYDESGDDTYSGYWYTLGSSAHLACSFLIDGQGSDTYESSHTCIGCAHDLSYSMHLDQGSESDEYTHHGSLGMGAGYSMSLGFFINESGDDTYHSTNTDPTAFGRVGTQSDMPRTEEKGRATLINLGMFLELGGTDTYDLAYTEPDNNKTWTPAGTHDTYDPDYDHSYGYDAE